MNAPQLKPVPYRKPATNEKRVYTIRMLRDRWNVELEEVMRLLQKHKPPIFGLATKVNYDKSVDEQNVMVNEDDIFNIEKKEKLSHSKLKSRKIILPMLSQRRQ